MAEVHERESLEHIKRAEEWDGWYTDMGFIGQTVIKIPSIDSEIIHEDLHDFLNQICDMTHRWKVPGALQRPNGNRR